MAQPGVTRYTVRLEYREKKGFETTQHEVV